MTIVCFTFLGKVFERVVANHQKEKRALYFYDPITQNGDNRSNQTRCF